MNPFATWRSSVPHATSVISVVLLASSLFVRPAEAAAGVKSFRAEIGHVVTPAATASGRRVGPGRPETPGDYSSVNRLSAAGLAGKRLANTGRSTPSNATEVHAASEIAQEPAAGPAPSAPINGGSFTAFGPTSSPTPPDPTLAAGPHELLAATNSGLSVFNKNFSSVSGKTSQNFATFFNDVGTPASDFLFDPKAVYDEYIQRFWFLIASESDSPQRSNILLGLSDTSDASGTWHVWALDMTTGDSAYWCDYPQIGFDSQAIYLTCNMFAFPSQGSNAGDFQYAKIRVMTKDQFLNDACCYWADFLDLREETFNTAHSFTVQPAHMYGAVNSDGEYLVDAAGQGHSDDEYVVRRITNAQVCCVPGHQGAPDIHDETLEASNFDEPPDAEQQGTSQPIDTGDSRLLFAYWEFGHLNTGHTVSCHVIPFASSDACAAFEEIDVSNFPDDLSAVNDWVYDGSTSNTYFPQVDVNSDGRTMVFSGSDSCCHFAGAYWVDIPPSSQCTTCVGEQTTLQTGKTSYNNIAGDPKNRNRWGDYLGASGDPDGIGIWIHGEFASSTANQWATQVGITQEVEDFTPPTTQALLSPLPTPDGWNNGPVQVTLVASDIGRSGVRSITYQVSGASTIGPVTHDGPLAVFTVNGEGDNLIQYSARDNWGNVEALKSLHVLIDTGAPEISCAQPDGQWHANDVSLECVAADAGSGLASGSPSAFFLSTHVPAGIETADAQTDTRTICDKSGNCVTAGPIGGNEVDKKPPTITINVPSGATYIIKQQAAADYSCQDGGSGVATCAGPVLNGANLDTLSVGIHTFTVNAADAVGNASTSSAQYTVTYRICLQYDPMKPNGGRAYVITVQICDYNNVNLSTMSIKLTATAVDGNSAKLKALGTLNPGNVFLYGPGTAAGASYFYNLDTKGLAAGPHVLNFSVQGDPVPHTAPFLVKK